MGLSQKEASTELEISVPTVQQYERGSRFKDGRPVTIPDRIARACEETRKRLRKDREFVVLSTGLVPVEIFEQVRATVSAWGLKIPVEHLFCFDLEKYMPFVSEIQEWLAIYGADKGFVSLMVPNKEAAGGGVVVFHFRDKNDAFAFIMRFRGYRKDS